MYAKNYVIHTDRFPPIIPSGEYYLTNVWQTKRNDKLHMLGSFRVFIDIIAKGIAEF